MLIKNRRPSPLGQIARDALKAAVRNHPDWKAIRKSEVPASNAETWGNASNDDWFELADRMGIDLGEAFNLAANATTADDKHSVTETALMASEEAYREHGSIIDASQKAAVTARNVAPTVAPTAQENAQNAPDSDEAAPTDDKAARAVSAVLDKLEPFVAPAVLKDVKPLLKPLETMARKAAETAAPIVLRVRDNGDGTTTPIREPRPIKQVQASKLFGLRSRALSKVKVWVWDGMDVCPDRVPTIDPDHIFTEDILLECLTCLEHGDHMWAAGPASTGKTTTWAQICARLGRPYTRIIHHIGLDMPELIGQRVPDAKGNFTFQYGQYTDNVSVAGTVICLDEMSFCRPNALGLYQTTLDERYITIAETNEVVRFAPGVVCVICDNTGGHGDESGVYHGTNATNAALLDRCASIVNFSFLPPRLETKVVASRGNISEDVAAMLVSYATTTRRLFDKQELVMPCTLRRLVAWAKAISAGIPSENAFGTRVFNHANLDDRETIRQNIMANLDFSAIDTAQARAEIGDMSSDDSGRGADVTRSEDAQAMQNSLSARAQEAADEFDDIGDI